MQGQEAAMKWFKRRLTTTLLLLISFGVPAYASTPPGGTNHVPIAWTLYATAVSHQLQAELANAQSPAATRLHRFLDDEANSNPNVPAPAPVIRLWIGHDGNITHAEFASLGNPRANADLGQIILSTRLQNTLPESLPQPLILRLQLSHPI
jgi:hypothetical protein